MQSYACILALLVNARSEGVASPSITFTLHEDKKTHVLMGWGRPRTKIIVSSVLTTEDFREVFFKAWLLNFVFTFRYLSNQVLFYQPFQ